MGEILLTQRAQQQLIVLNALERGKIAMAEAARLIGRSIRQTRRLRRAYRLRGPAALVHGNRGRRSPRRLPDALRTHVVTLAKTTYAGTNYQHFQDLLAEREDLVVAYTSLARMLKAAGISSPRRRRPPRHRSRRERMSQEGMLTQMDASHHAWLEDRGPHLVLHANLDDATGKILGGWFDDEETANGYLHVFEQMALGPGLPLAAYSDRHGIFHRRPRQPQTIAEQLRGQRALTQIGRVLQELGIQWIPASSPQAKGRIERLFGAFQDRLVSELRLAGICDKDAANAFLPGFLTRYNARFTKPAAQPGLAYRPWPAGRDPATVFCLKYGRTVQLDNTITLGPYCLQVLPGPGGRSYGKAHVEVHHRLDGTFAVWYQGQSLPFHLLTTVPHPAPRGGIQISPRPRKTRPGASQKEVRARSRNKGKQSRSPRAGHPWRRLAAEAVRRKTLRDAGVTFSLVR